MSPELKNSGNINTERDFYQPITSTKAELVEPALHQSQLLTQVLPFKNRSE